jgi:hypothetical protein
MAFSNENKDKCKHVTTPKKNNYGVNGVTFLEFFFLISRSVFKRPLSSDLPVPRPCTRAVLYAREPP